MEKRLELRAARDFSMADVALYLYERAVGSGERVAVATNVVMEKSEPTTLCAPVVRLSEHGAQRLLQDLWDSGFRPADYTDDSGEVRALRGHLEDLRLVQQRLFQLLFRPPADAVE